MIRLGPRGEDGRRATVRLHRWVVEKVEGRTLAPEDVVRHTCDVRDCFLYEHLRVGTQRDNNLDMRAKGREHFTGGEGNGNAKLTNETIEQIRAMYAAGGVSQYQLARAFGVGQPAISRVVARKRWASV